MADDTTSGIPSSSGRFPAGGGREGGRRAGGNREGGNREPGGFRIRLSDNEMRAARAVQDAFHLRSTVAALGFSIRTVAQLLEEGKLDALVAEQRAQAGNRPERRGERRSERPTTPRIDPFARPSKPAPTAAEAPAEPAPEAEAAQAEAAQADVASEPVLSEPEAATPEAATTEATAEATHEATAAASDEA